MAGCFSLAVLVASLCARASGGGARPKPADATTTLQVESSIYLPVDRTGDSVAPSESGLLAEWIFAQKDGDIVPDASKHGFDAHVCGHPRLVAGPGDSQALEFGGNDAESVPGASNGFWSGGRQDYGLSIGKRLDREFKALSVEAWVRKSPGWWMPVVYRDLWNSPSGFGLYAEWSSGRMAFGHYDDSGNSSEVFSKATVQDGQWHHVQAVCDSMSGSDGQLRFTVVNAAGRTIDTPLSRMRLCMASI